MQAPPLTQLRGVDSIFYCLCRGTARDDGGVVRGHVCSDLDCSAHHTRSTCNGTQRRCIFFSRIHKPTRPSHPRRCFKAHNNRSANLLVAVRDPVRNPLVVVLRQQLVRQLRGLVRASVRVGRRAARLRRKRTARETPPMCAKSAKSLAPSDDQHSRCCAAVSRQTVTVI